MKSIWILFVDLALISYESHSLDFVKKTVLEASNLK